MTIPDPVRQQAEAMPEALALVTGTSSWTWAELDAHVAACAARLADAPDRVAVRAQTSPDLVVAVLGALRARRTIVPLSTRWTEASVADALQSLGIDRLWSEAPVEVAGVRVEPLVDLVDGERFSRGEAPVLDLAQPFTIVHTSGSTGTPKAILHTVGNHVWSARGVIEALDVRPADRWLLDLPLYHVGGLGIVMRAALAGAALAVPPRDLALADRIRRLAPTHASFVATQLRRLLDAGVDLSSLRAVLLGGSAIPDDLVESALEQGVPIAVSYGLTEMTSTVTATPRVSSRDDLATSGGVLPHRRLRIAPSGEIEVGGPTLSAGVVTPTGLLPLGPWHPTGDLGRLDDEGRLLVTGRRDLQFVSGGENIRPEAIEAALLAFDAVAEAVVVPIPDAEFGQRPVAFVAGAGPLDAAALAEALRQRLPGFMVPVAFHPWVGAAGLKPDRPALAQEAERRAAESEEAGG